MNKRQFYKQKDWKHLRQKVLELDHYECQICKAKGKYTRADTVHHVNHIEDRPDLALSIYYNGERNLLSVCKDCHNSLHPEKMKRFERKKPLTPERW